MIKYTPKDPAPPTEEYVVVNGRIAGAVEFLSRDSQYRAVLSFTNNQSILARGATKEEAINNAINGAIEIAHTLNEEAVALAVEIGGDDAK